MSIDKPRFLFFCLIVLSFIVVSCQQKSDLSLLESNNCIPPCWKGITPGATTEENAIAQLSEMGEVKQDTIKRDNASHFLFDNQIFWDFEKASFGGISVDEGIVVEIRLEKMNANLSEIIALFGKPEQIMFLPYNGREWRINILYPRQGIWLNYSKKHTSNGTMINLTTNDRVENIKFISPDLYNDFLSFSANPFLNHESLQLENILQPWNGYREEKILMSK